MQQEACAVSRAEQIQVVEDELLRRCVNNSQLVALGALSSVRTADVRALEAVVETLRGPAE